MPTQEQVRQLDELCLTLENDRQFYDSYQEAYRSRPTSPNGREYIRFAMERLGLRYPLGLSGDPGRNKKACREYIRRHMDERYEFKRSDDEAQYALFKMELGDPRVKEVVPKPGEVFTDGKLAKSLVERGFAIERAQPPVLMQWDSCGKSDTYFAAGYYFRRPPLPATMSECFKQAEPGYKSDTYFAAGYYEILTASEAEPLCRRGYTIQWRRKGTDSWAHTVPPDKCDTCAWMDAYGETRFEYRIKPSVEPPINHDPVDKVFTDQAGNPILAVIGHQPKEQSTMTIKIENKTFVNGIDVNEMTDDQVFDAIARAEAQIKHYETLGVKPKAIQKKIEDLKAGITELVRLSDERFDAKKAA